MSEDEIAYHVKRANQEYIAARDARHPSAVIAHLILAEMHIDRIYAKDAVAVPGRSPPLLVRVSAFG